MSNNEETGPSYIEFNHIECPVCLGTGQSTRDEEEENCFMCSGSGKITVPPFADLGDQGHWAKQMHHDQPCGLSDHDVETLATYWCDFHRYETLGQFIRRVGARVLQNLQLSAGQTP